MLLLCYLAVGMGRAALFMQAAQVRTPQQKQQSSPPKQVSMYYQSLCIYSDFLMIYFMCNSEMGARKNYFPPLKWQKFSVYHTIIKIYCMACLCVFNQVFDKSTYIIL